MLTWTEAQTKFQKISGDYTPATLEQAKSDMNIGQQRFNAALGRYFSRKQQFTDLIEQQGIYQTPIDCVKVLGMTVLVSQTYQPPVKEIRSEYQWRQITSYPYTSNWPTYYFMIGNDELSLWPTPSQSVTNGLRFYYQQQDYSLSIEDVTSDTTNQTVTVTNGSTLVTATGGVFTPDMVNLWFQVSGVNNLNWYEIVDVPTASTLTLKSPYVGLSGSAQAWRIGQSFIFPQEYDDVPIDYALARFFEGRNNSVRAKSYYNEDPNNLGRYNAALKDAIENYSSSNESSVITSDDQYLNPWMIPPIPGPIT